MNAKNADAALFDLIAEYKKREAAANAIGHADQRARAWFRKSFLG